MRSGGGVDEEPFNRLQFISYGFLIIVSIKGRKNNLIPFVFQNNV